jgi:hypothetical protein
MNSLSKGHWSALIAGLVEVAPVGVERVVGFLVGPLLLVISWQRAFLNFQFR